MDQSTYLQRLRYKVATYGQQGSAASNRYLDRNGSYHTETVAGRALDNTGGYCCEPPTVPEPPFDIAGVPANVPSAQLYFTPGSDGRSPITNYLVSFDGVTYEPVSPPVTGPPILIEDLSYGTTYTFYLKAVNEVGESEPSDGVTVIIPDLPAAPTNLIGTPGLASISVAFTAGYDGGSDIFNYWYSLNGGPLIALSPADITSPVTIPGLNSGTSYTIRLAAQNAMGVGAISAPITVTTTIPASTPPTLLLAVADDEGAYIYYTKGTGTITNYEWSTDGTTFTALDPAITTSPVRIPGLANGSPATIYLRSVISGGATSNSSNSVDVTPTATPSSVGPTLLYDAAGFSGGSVVVNSAFGGAVVSGTLTNVTYNLGIAGGVFDFPGNGYINFGTYNFGNLISVCAWIYPRTKSNLNGLLSTRGSGGGGIGGFTFGWNNYNSPIDRALCAEMANGSPLNQMDKPSTVGGIIIYSPPEWQHVAYVYSKVTNTLIFYKNGVAQTVTGIACPLNVITNKDFNIGALQDRSFGMNAQLGYLKVFGDTLNATDIYNDYNTTKSRFGL